MIRPFVKVLILLIFLMITLLSWRMSLARGVEHVLRIDDFEDGDLRAPTGLSWITLADDLMGGESVARLEIVTGKDAASRGALRLAGRRSGRKTSFVGAWLPLEGAGRPLDLRAFEGVRLRVKGTGQVLVGFRAGNVNYMAAVEASAEWRVEAIPFDRLAPQGQVPEGTRFSPNVIQWFGVTTPPIPPGREVPASDIAFEIDDLELYGRAEESMEPIASGSPGPVTILPFVPLASIPAVGWLELATDPEGDASAPLLPDVTRLEVHPQSADGMIWFRMTLRETPHDRWMGVNLALDVDGNPENGQPWWGANSAFRFDRLLSVYCFPVVDGCQGMFGVVDSDQAASGTVWGGGDVLRFAIDRDRRAFVVGVPRAALSLGSGPNRLVAAVGSALFFGDDVPGQGAALIR